MLKSKTLFKALVDNRLVMFNNMQVICIDVYMQTQIHKSTYFTCVNATYSDLCSYALN